MNEQELLDGLHAIRQERTTYPDVAEVHRQVLAISIEQIPPRRGWLSLFPSWGYGSMFSARKFIAAAAIVALFGGFLLSGVLTTPQDGEVLPAAVTESPSPMTTDELLAGMVTEEVEPGVFRVVNDGVRDLSFEGWSNSVVAGYDGGIWLLREDRFLRLGSDRSHGWPAGVAPEDHVFEVAPDGTMWVIPNATPGYPARHDAGLRSTDGEEWTVQPCPGPEDSWGMTAAPDGSVWASWTDVTGPWRVGQLGPTAWQQLDELPGASHRLFLTEAGDLYGVRYLLNNALHRYEDGGWQRISLGSPPIDIGPDGTVWRQGSGDGIARFAESERAA